MRAEKELSSVDQRQRFAVDFVYDLDAAPHMRRLLPERLTAGWQVSGIYKIGGGLPITPLLDPSGPWRERLIE